MSYVLSLYTCKLCFNYLHLIYCNLLLFLASKTLSVTKNCDVTLHIVHNKLRMTYIYAE